MKKRKAPLLFGGAILLLILYVVVESVNLNPLYREGAFFWGMVLSIFLLIFTFVRSGPLLAFRQENREDGRGGRFAQNTFGAVEIRFPRWTKIALIVIWGFILLMNIISSPLISWNAYRSQLGQPEIKTFSEDLQAVDLSQVPIVDKSLAYNLANKKLGERPGLGSQAVLGEPIIQQVNGKLVWVAPLYHSGLFKWLTNMDGTPGYIVVSATNVNDVTYVEDYKIKYQPNAFLFDNLTRYVRFTSSLFRGITDYSFELDDSGQPYWVVTTYRNKAGFALPEATGAVLVNATTGQWERYSLEEIPEWVDRVQPEDFILNQIDNSGIYVHGIFNFSNKDKFQTSEGNAIVYNDGDCYLFTGLTSVGSDDSAIGFMMVDMVTKEPYKYQIAGATEQAAQRSAEGKVQNYGYEATFPLIINLEGQPTYFMSLKDRDAGLIKQYAFVSVVNYSIVGTGETISDALSDYNRSLKNSGVSSDFSVQGEEETVTAQVARIASEVNGNETVYKLLLEGQDPIFIASAALSDELALTQPGDRVTIRYYQIDSPVQQVSSFDNLAF